jgi:16S rRNA (adenine1518-N6/adenine1519-N6)-dimethyltransferase
MESLTDLRYIQHLLGKKGIAPNYAAGQNFLVSPEVIEATLLAMKGGPKLVTELGSGLGALTQGLVTSGYQVRAIERDRNLIALLCGVMPRAKYPNLEVEENDLRSAEWSHTEAYQLVGNIPYNLSGFIFRRITQLKPAPDRVILLVQKEVAQRVTATVPDMNLLALAISLWGKAEILLDVPRNCFWPQPEVESALIMLAPQRPNPLSTQEREAILTTSKSFFQAKRKQIGGIIRKVWPEKKGAAQKWAAAHDIDLAARPENLTTKHWQQLHHFLTDTE